MAAIQLVIGDKAYSSWSLRPWLALKMIGVPFEEIRIKLRRPETRAEILRHSPSGKVPLLKHKGVELWESLAILEFLAETYPAAHLWPEDAAARARARAVSSEMHAGFAPLRQHMSMDVTRDLRGQGMGEGVASDIARIEEIWSGCRAAYGAGGPYLFGHFTAADAMYAPVATRFVTYGTTLSRASAAYRDAIMALPAMKEWIAAAKREVA
ncbi:MAG TPA: glutathione S-transferase family protein [Alphaproteobacteria bacterium]|nr:glutathione S-transferase family protein [Alphaproteobacteria bacterium]